jgi:hypothetical protein
MKPQRVVASFDSASAMLRVLGQHLHGADSPALGLGPSARLAGLLLPAVNHFPSWARELLYARSGAWEAVRASQLSDIDTDDVAGWIADHYPRRRYPAVMIGSSSGAVTHLAALAGVPWLPQTLLVPVKHGGLDPDRPAEAMAALADARAAFTKANPGIALHHMHDPNQDRLMIQRMAYFRYKYRVLPPAYAHFLKQCLEPGGTVVVTECTERWPVTVTGERQVFQHGAVGGASAEEYQRGGERVRRFLAEHGSAHRSWEWPHTDGEGPEAEWGFEPALLSELDEFCRAEGFRLQRLTFPHAQALSGPVAEMYRAWYAETGVPTDRLLVDCFALLDVDLPLRRGLVPYWTVFSTQDAAAELVDYLDHTRRYREIHIGLFAHGTRSIGVAGLADWDRALGRATETGGYCGVDRRVYPQDFASNVRFHDELARLGEPVRPRLPGWPWVRDRLAERVALNPLMRQAGESSGPP